MKKIIIILFLFFTVIVSLRPSIIEYVLLADKGATVSATIKGYSFGLSGIIAPFASVILTSDNIYIRSTVADSNGKFIFNDITVGQGFSHFCLEGIDYKRLGESYTCLTIDPVNHDTSIDNIFLPPTIGVYRGQIRAGTEATIFGYSMPDAKVLVHLSNNRFVINTRDQGYYELHTKLNTAGIYHITAEASLGKQNSLKPERGVVIQALSTPEIVTNWLVAIIKLLISLLTTGIGLLLVALGIITVIFILLRKLLEKSNPTKAMFIEKDADMQLLHHAWFIGY